MPRGHYERKPKVESKEVEVADIVDATSESVQETFVKPFKENVLHGTISKPEVNKVRKYSDAKDHKGQGEPLCFKCGHRQDMHHTWTYHEVHKTGQDFLKEVIQYVDKWKEVKIEHGNRPCQHACLCTNFE